MIKYLILILVFVLIPFWGLTNAQTDVILEERPLSEAVAINGIRIKILRPWSRKEHKTFPSKAMELPEELKPHIHKKSQERFYIPLIKPLYYDSIDYDKLRNLA